MSETATVETLTAEVKDYIRNLVTEGDYSALREWEMNYDPDCDIRVVGDAGEKIQ